ncbi:MAG TPA: hypothetical protein VFB89_07165 [Gemmatimonadales bacterium]|nr:hypothetical protein [Gemmatimonadales bacterium]
MSRQETATCDQMGLYTPVSLYDAAAGNVVGIEIDPLAAGQVFSLKALNVTIFP